MNLLDVYEAEGRQGLVRLAKKAGTSAKYLYHCATGRREPSPRMARRLVAADSRLTLEALYQQKAA